MIDYKKWKLLNESLAATGGVLGISNTPAVGGVQGIFRYLDEKKKHMHKDAELDDEGSDLGDVDVDADDVDVDDEDMGNDDEDMGQDDDGCGEGKFCSKKMKKGMKKKMKNECDCMDKAKKGNVGDEDEDADLEDAEEDMGADLDGDDEEGEPVDHKKKVLPLGFMKKKGMKKKMKKEAAEQDWMTSLTNGYVSEKNQMDDEGAFWKSLASYNYDPNQRFSDGFKEIKEDLLIPTAEQPAAPAQPGPGEVGFAPQQRIGDPAYQVPPLEESKKPFKSWLNS